MSELVLERLIERGLHLNLPCETCLVQTTCTDLCMKQFDKIRNLWSTGAAMLRPTSDEFDLYVLKYYRFGRCRLIKTEDGKLKIDAEFTVAEGVNP